MSNSWTRVSLEVCTNYAHINGLHNILISYFPDTNISSHCSNASQTCPLEARLQTYPVVSDVVGIWVVPFLY